MNGNGNRLVSIVAASALALSSGGCGVFGGKEEAPEKAPSASTVGPSTSASGVVDATHREAPAPAAPQYVVRTYHVGSGRNIVVAFEEQAYRAFTATLASAAYLGKVPKGEEGRFELESALRADANRDGLVTLAESQALKAAADGRVTEKVGVPADYLK